MKKQYLYLLLVLLFVISCKTKPSYASFEEYPVYEGSDLELTYSPTSSSFRVWAPTATNVKLLLYDDGYEGGAYDVLDMKESESGTWLLTIEKDLKGKFYTFQIKINETWLDETPGIWVKATGVNGKRAAIIDFAETNPEGWEDDKRPMLDKFTDISIYELDIRDFSLSAHAGIKNKGKFLSLTEFETKNQEGESTGIDHLKELGITHIQLLPVFDGNAIDETKPYEKQLKQGYYPQNFNTLEGSYSTNPYNPSTRVYEFKQMIQSLHKNGIRVIMEVVYNRTSQLKNSTFDLLAPNYFYRMNADSTWSNATGAGNETASERAMMKKFMVESVVFWATEYHIDGFCFNSMALHDVETMNEIRDALDRVDPSIYVFGEGYIPGVTSLSESKRASKMNEKDLENIGFFNDDIFKVLMGDESNPEVTGFINGKDSINEEIKNFIVGGTMHPQVNAEKLILTNNHYSNTAGTKVNALSRFSSMYLVNKLKSNDTVPQFDILKLNRLMQTILFTSQGVPFIAAGEEMYDSNDSIYKVNWDAKSTNKEYFEFYKGLVSLRKQHAAFRIPTQEMLSGHLKFLDVNTPRVVAFILTDHVNGEIWKDILVVYNASENAVNIELPPGEWNLICHDDKINLSGISVVNTTTFLVPSVSTSILYTK